MEELVLRDYIKQFKKGNLDSFDDFYEQTKKGIFYNILALTKNYDISEDLLQDTFVIFLKNINNIKDSESIMGYLIVISRNVTLDYFKKNNRNREIDEIRDDLSYRDKHFTDHDILIEHIAKILKPKELEIFSLHVLSELTFDEISKVLHKPLGTILWNYNNSIKKLQKELKYENE